MDQQTEENLYEIITEYPGISNASYFFWFDMPVAFDPCVCNNDVALEIRAAVENNWNVSIKGTLDAQLLQQGTPTQSNHSALTVKRIVGAAKATATAFATGGTVIQTSEFEKLLDIFSQRPGISGQAERNVKLLKETLTTASNAVYDFETMKWKNVVTNEEMNKSDWTKLISGVGSYLNAGVDYFNPLAKAKAPRTSVVGSITATGTATLNSTSGDVVYWGIPGSDWTSYLDEVVTAAPGGLLPEYPIYNNPLGTFALLKTPTIKVKRDEIPICNAIDPFTGEKTRSPRSVFTLFFDNELLEYYFNPVLNLNEEKLEVKASVVVRAQTAGFEESFFGDEEGTECMSSQHGLNEFELIRGTNIYESVDLKERLSPPVHIDYLNDMAIIFTGNGENLSVDDFQYFIRFNIEGESTTIGRDGTPNKISQVMTFPLNPVSYTGQMP